MKKIIILTTFIMLFVVGSPVRNSELNVQNQLSQDAFILFPEAAAIIEEVRSKPRFFVQTNTEPGLVYYDETEVQVDGKINDYKIKVFDSGEYEVARLTYFETITTLPGDFNSGSGYSTYSGELIAYYYTDVYSKTVVINNITFTIVNGGYDLINSISSPGQAGYMQYDGGGNYSYNLVLNSYKRSESSASPASIDMRGGNVGFIFEVGANKWSAEIY